MSVADATEYTRRMVRMEARGPGDTEGALDRLARRYGLSRWTLSHLRKGRAKSVDAGIMARLRTAYVDYLERQIAAFQHEIAVERAKADGGVDVDDLERAVADVAAQIVAWRAEKSTGSHGRMGGGRR